jgi:hypothetical protein
MEHWEKPGVDKFLNAIFIAQQSMKAQKGNRCIALLFL